MTPAAQLCYDPRVGRIALLLLVVAACGDNTTAASCADPPGAFAAGDPDGHPDPLHAGPTEARAGRIKGSELPVVPSGLITWKDNDFVLANDKVALVIEDVGDSDLYDPWGGRPVGLARVDGGQLVEPNNFGEVFFLTGRSTIITDHVSVIADGSDGGTAIIRASGKLHPLPFFESVIAVLFKEPWLDIDAAIDYELAPGSEHVDVRYRYSSPRGTTTDLPSVLHALMYTKRTPVFQPNKGFDESLDQPYLALVDEQATSWAYIPASGTFGGSISVSGFVGAVTPGFTMPACGTTDHVHAQIVIGGPGLDGVVDAVARTQGNATRELTGTVTRAGVAAANVHVHALDGNGAYLTRVLTDASGNFTLHVAAAADVTLEAYRRGDQVAMVHVGTGSDPSMLDFPATGAIHVTATENGAAVPVRVQVLPAEGQTVPSVPVTFGELQIAAGRLHVAFATAGDVSLDVPPGKWEVVVSRGYEYELVRQTIQVVAGTTVEVTAPMERVVDTTNVQCGDFHVHTWRSNDSGDDSLAKVAQAVADGVELPVRSDHEWIADFSAEIAQLGVGQWAHALSSIELTSFEVWGHMGVFPLVAEPTAVNAGAPKWQTFPTADQPSTPFATLSPPAVFDAVRARPEAPIVIINHPRGGANYFDYVGYDAATGLVSSVSDWDTKFTLVEVFNNSGWLSNRAQNVEDWLGLLHAGRKVFAVGSSDSHVLSSSPVGYPRTCVQLGTDDPQQVTPNLVRDQLAAGHAAISGGIYVGAKLGTTNPGDTTTGAGSPMQVDVTVQAATWVDVTNIEVIVDGQTVDTIPIMPSDADPTNPVLRWHGQIPVQVAAAGGYIVIAAYGGTALEPVHPGNMPFGVTEPIFVTP